MAIPLQLPKWHFNVPGTNTPAIGYLFYSFAAGTTTFQNTFTDYTGTIPNANPMVCDDNGDVVMWLSNNKSYKFIFTTPNDQDPTTHLPSSPIWTLDNINTPNLYNTISVSTNTTITTSQTGIIFLSNCTNGNLTFTSPSPSSAGTTFNITIIKTDSSSNSWTFTPSSGTVNGSSNFTCASQYQGVTFFTDGTNWYTAGTTISESIFDSNMNTVIATSAVTSPAVSYFTSAAALTTNNPQLSVSSSNTNQGYTINSKGNGGFNLGGGTGIAKITSGSIQLFNDQPITDSSGNNYISFSKTASAVNYLTITNSATGNPPTIEVAGTDTNISTNIQNKGTGVTNILGTSTAPGTLTLQNQTSNNTDIVSIQPSNITGNRTFTLPDQNISHMYVNQGFTSTGAVATGTNAWPLTNAIPTTSAGTQFMSITYTPQTTGNLLNIYANLYFYASSNNVVGMGLFQDSTVNALCETFSNMQAGVSGMVTMMWQIIAVGGVSTTFKLYAGPTSGGTITFNGNSGVQIGGGAVASIMQIMEYTA